VGSARSLASVHAAGLLHRRVAPENFLLVRESQETFLIDFGSVLDARSTWRGGRSQPRSSPVASPVRTLLRYCAPEQTGRMDRTVDHRSDLYALGATLYHLLVGSPPFEYSDALELIHAHLARRPHAPESLRPELPRALSELVMRLLAKEPAERYDDAGALLADLKALQGQWECDGRWTRTSLSAH